MAELTLEARLRALGAGLEFTDEATLADDVLAALDLADVCTRRWRRPLVAAAAVVVILAATVLAIPGSRRTIAGWLGFDELRIERVEVTPPTVTVPVPPTNPVAPTGTIPAEQLVDAYERVGAGALTLERAIEIARSVTR